jgi:threonine/homoserine/homoserine lactone efflux protein
MIMSEYEERFRSPTPSPHQTLAAARGIDRGRRRSRRLWVAATLVGVITMTCTVASNRTIYSETGNVLASMEVQCPITR